MVETTGLADPLPVAMTFLGSDLRDLTRLDSIITLIDAENFSDSVLDSEVARAQVVYGDILLLNKCDLVPPERLERLEDQLRSIKNEARILRSVKGEVSLPLLLSVGLFESDRVAAQQDHSDCDHDHNHCVHDHGSHDHDHGAHDHGTHAHGAHDHGSHDHGSHSHGAHAADDHGHHGHEHEPHAHDDAHRDDHGHHHETSHSDAHHQPGLAKVTSHNDHLAIEGFTSLSFVADGPFSLRKFQNFLDHQLPAEVFRAKGILWFNESDKRHIFHLAGKRFSIDDSVWTGARKNQLVLIGKDLNHSRLRRQLQACVARDAGKGFS